MSADSTDPTIAAMHRIAKKHGQKRAGPPGFPYELALKHRMDPATGRPDWSQHFALKAKFDDTRMRIAESSEYGAGLSAWFANLQDLGEAGLTL